MSYLTSTTPDYVKERRDICYSNKCGMLKGKIIKRCGHCGCPIKQLTSEPSMKCRDKEEYWSEVEKTT